MRVAMVTTSEQSVLYADVDRPLNEVAFAARGVELVPTPWDDPAVDWGSFDLVVVRSPWDYTERLDRFLAWLEARKDLATLHNPAAVIRWNLDKHYLDDLAGLGVTVVPTRFADDHASLETALEEVAQQSPELVVKPSISAGSRLTGRFRAGSGDAAALGGRILDRGLDVMVQPFASSIDERGEHSAVAFDGLVSHAFCKGPILAEEGRLRGDVYTEEVTPIVLSGAELGVVADTLAATRVLARGQGWLGSDENLLYARIDMVTLDDGTPALLEAELFEPCFFLPVDPPAVERFVDAVIARVRSPRVPRSAG